MAEPQLFEGDMGSVRVTLPPELVWLDEEAPGSWCVYVGAHGATPDEVVGRAIELLTEARYAAFVEVAIPEATAATPASVSPKAPARVPARRQACGRGCVG